MSWILLVILGVQCLALFSGYSSKETLLLLLTVAGISYIYSLNNPLGHSRKFRIRNYWNWLPMGFLYAFLYWGRYNLTQSKIALGPLMTKEAFGIIFAAGTWTYALSFLINGPLIDKIGGKKGMIIGGAGAALANIGMGIVTYLLLHNKISANTTVIFAVLYAVNMYFQSYGAVSIVKLNSNWFHIKERGIFGGIFGSLIALGLLMAFSWSSSIEKATLAVLPEGHTLSGIESLLRSILMPSGATMNQTWQIFFVPAFFLLALVIVEVFLLKDTPSEAGFEDFDCQDASSGEMNDKISMWEIIKRIMTNPIILTIAVIEFCSGILRNGVMHWYPIYAKEISISGAAAFFKTNWGTLLFLAGMYSGFFAGIVSDKFFQSRRGPSAVFLYVGMFISILIMIASIVIHPSWMVLGMSVVFTSFCVIGVHGMLSGSATMDFGGRRGAATAVGMIDGFVYLGTGLQSISLGFITTRNWNWWPVFLLPFTIVGIILSLKIWKAFPTAKAKGH